MGLILGLLIILIILYVLGVDIHIIMGIVLAVGVLIVLVMEIVFAVSAVILAGTKKCTGKFSRIEKGDGSFDRVYYTVDGMEYPNAFPCEVTLRSAIYKPDREVALRLSEKMGKVFDTNARAASAVGLVLCTIGLVIFGILGFSML